VHDKAARKEAFQDWKEQYVHERFLDKEIQLRDEMDQNQEAAARLHAEFVLERELHEKQRSDVIVKMFSEKISPSVHDKAARREGFGMVRNVKLISPGVHDKAARREGFGMVRSAVM
jgi:hypothetical protein